MLRVTKLKGAEYLIHAVADGMEDYFMGAGEAPGVWRGRWAAELGLEGVVAADDLRALVNGHDPATGEDWLAGHRERKVRAIDVTMSVPKSVSVLWALGTETTAAEVSLALVEATDVALRFMEEHAAFAREQADGRRRRVDTSGFAIATFAHRVSRDGDPHLHNHCLIPNMVRREGGDHVAFDANPLHIWNKAVGTVFLNHLEGLLTQRLGVAWGPERNGSREMVGFSADQLRAFSKRTVAIETRLEANGELVFDSKAERMRADERASLATRARKDKAMTPELLRQRWITEAEQVGLHPGAGVDDLVIGRQMERGARVSDAELAAALVDPNTGLCATESKFCEAHVVERIAAISGGRMSLEEVVEAGSQGGTWRQVHLLGTPALDRYRGYVGQSRGQDPTHTWNTRPEAEHPLSLLADERTPAEAVLDALRRDEPKAFAAWDDPSVLDRRLREERAEHAEVIATRPPDRRRQLDEARKALKNAVEEMDSAVKGLLRREDERTRLGPLTRLRRGGGDHIVRADQALEGARRRLDRAEHDVNEARLAAARRGTAVAERAAWDRTNAWRLHRVAEIDEALAHHWAEVSLRSVRAEDPLAFGVERLRAARSTYKKDLDRLVRALPLDRRDELTRAEADLHRQEETLRHSERRCQRAQADRIGAGERRWGRRDKVAVESAERALTDVEAARDRCAEAAVQARQRVEKKKEAVRTWTEATKKSADERSGLARAVAELDDALKATRARRVSAAAQDPNSELWRSLGPPPPTRGGLAAWCGIADRLEEWMDSEPSAPPGPVDRIAPRPHPILGSRPKFGAARPWDQLALLLDQSPELVRTAAEHDPAEPGKLLEDQALWRHAFREAADSIDIEPHTRGFGIEP